MRVLKLHQDYPDNLVAQAVTQALAYGCAHTDGVKLCLHQMMNLETPMLPMDVTDWPELSGVGSQLPDVTCYDQLLGGR